MGAGIRPHPVDRPLVQSVSRAVDILEALAEEGRELGVSDLSRRVGLPKSTLFGLLSTLADRGLVQRNAAGQYRLGLRLFELGNRVLEGADLRQVAHPLLERLVAEFRETAHLVVLDRGEAVYIDKVESPESMRIVTRVGTRLPAHCSAVGKSILAHLPEEQLDEIVRLLGLPRLTAHTITDSSGLKRHLAQVRAQGFATDDEEVSEGLSCVGAPVWDHTGCVVAAVSIAAPTNRLRGEKHARIVEAVKLAAREISDQLGGRTAHRAF